MGALFLTVLSQISLAVDDEPALDVPRSCQGLIALFALQDGRRIDRAQASFKLWPDTTEKKARHNLSTALWRLRKCDERLAPIFPTDSSSHIQIADETVVNSDVQRFLKAFKAYQQLDNPTEEERNAAMDASRLASGDPLPGIDAEWADIERERLISLQTEFLFKLASDCEKANEFEEAIRFGDALVKRDPFREDVHRLLMRLHVKAGNRAKAIAQYRTCQGEIGAALGVSPMPETIALYEDLVALPDRSRAPQTPEQIRNYTQAIRSNARDAMRIGTRQREKLVQLLDYAERIDQIEI